MPDQNFFARSVVTLINNNCKLQYQKSTLATSEKSIYIQIILTSGSRMKYSLRNINTLFHTLLAIVETSVRLYSYVRASHDKRVSTHCLLVWCLVSIAVAEVWFIFLSCLLCTPCVAKGTCTEHTCTCRCDGTARLYSKNFWDCLLKLWNSTI